jgi:predicted 2-oxoglutarate/Fe(II)-dependent dioxygenase YbiX
MVITYNQNLHFRMHKEKLQKQDYNSFHCDLIIQKIHTKVEYKLTVEVCASLYYSKPQSKL